MWRGTQPNEAEPLAEAVLSDGVSPESTDDALEPDGRPVAAAANDKQLEVELRRLKSLHEDGLITEDEYAVKRRSLLGL